MTTFDDLAARLRANAQRTAVGSTDVPLAIAQDRMRACEEALDRARSLCRQAARREGRKISNLFADSMFVSRVSAERWIDSVRDEMREEVKAARAEGERAGVAHIDEAAQTLAQSIVLAGDRRRGERPMAPDSIQREIHKGKVIDPQTLSQQIIAAGKKARRLTGED
jgi:hypothetical protein